MCISNIKIEFNSFDEWFLAKSIQIASAYYISLIFFWFQFQSYDYATDFLYI